MRIDVLILDGVFDLGLAAILDTLTLANELAAAEGTDATRFDLRRVAMRQRVSTHQGLRVPVTRAKPRSRCDVAIVPALGSKTPEAIDVALARPDVREACTWLRARARAGARVSAACTGTFVLAESGLLDGGNAVTSWWLAPAFRARFPTVQLDDTAMVVEHASCVTAGAALAHLDLALWLIRGVSPTLAARVSRYLLIEARPTPALYAIPDHLAHDDPIVRRFERWARRELSRPFELGAASRASGTSERTLARRVRQVLGKTPLGYVQALRIEHAVHRLRTSDATVDEIALEVGYRDGVTLRSLLRRKTGRGVKELRRVS